MRRLLLIILLALPMFGTARKWTGTSGTDLNWATAGNWNPSGAPTSSDVLTFDNTCTNCDSTIAVGANVASVTMAANYPGTVTQSAGLILTPQNGTSGFAFLGGTWNGAGQTITFGNGGTTWAQTLSCSGNFNTLTGGTSVTISNGSGSDLTIASGCTVSATVNESTSGSAGGVRVQSSAVLNGIGNWTGKIASNSGTISASGSSITTFQVVNSGLIDFSSATSWSIGGVLTNNVGGTILYGGSAITVTTTNGGSWTQNGTFDISGKTITFSGTTWTETFNCTGDFNATTGASLVLSMGPGSTFIVPSGCTVTANISAMSGSITTQASAGFSSTGTGTVVHVTNYGTFTLGGNLTATGNWTNYGTFTAAAGTLSVTGNWTNFGTFNHNNGTVSFTDANHTLTGPTQFKNLTFATPALARTITFQTFGTDTASHRYWRIYATANAFSNQISMAEVQLLDAGSVNRIGSGTVSASQAGASWPVTNSVDGNPATFWSNYTGGSGYPQWWKYDFGLGNAFAIVSARITARSDAYYYESPTVFELQFSDDNSTWTRKGIIYNVTSMAMPWSQSGQTQTFTVGAPYVTTVAGTLTMAGLSGKLLTLAPDATGYQWHINASGARTLGYLSVSYSGNDNSCPLYAGTTSTNGGNNTNWMFSAPQGCGSVRHRIRIF